MAHYTAYTTFTLGTLLSFHSGIVLGTFSAPVHTETTRCSSGRRGPLKMGVALINSGCPARLVCLLFLVLFRKMPSPKVVLYILLMSHFRVQEDRRIMLKNLRKLRSLRKQRRQRRTVLLLFVFSLFLNSSSVPRSIWMRER